jgi:hypothetical protein
LEREKVLSFSRGVAQARVAFWASTIDAFLQDFLEKAEKDDELGTIVACARLAQLGAAISDEYTANCAALVSSDTEQKVAQQACGLVVELVNRNAETLLGRKSPEPVLGNKGSN